MPQVVVEFFGIPRERAGRASISVTAATLGDVLSELRRELPAFAEACLNGPALKPDYLAGIAGRLFTRDPAYSLNDGDSVQILSADAGG